MMSTGRKADGKKESVGIVKKKIILNWKEKADNEFVDPGLETKEISGDKWNSMLSTEAAMAYICF